VTSFVNTIWMYYTVCGSLKRNSGGHSSLYELYTLYCLLATRRDNTIERKLGTQKDYVLRLLVMLVKYIVTYNFRPRIGLRTTGCEQFSYND
jgi:hypothetical protein